MARGPSAGAPFTDWWQETVCSTSTPSMARKGTSRLIMLTAWWIWKHLNDAVFYNATPNIAVSPISPPWSRLMLCCGRMLVQLGLEHCSRRTETLSRVPL
ncbi:hypothetical protein BRADI_2g07573v3 [Brachypodium distachyon]|uniref:Reverse transcriptase zinc-binding domain-containing protein n=1 Tax=Brachypodium distachyon TaxID=15368 RepID=A0A0Q3JY41_BRADI|nr:hypothetical protein BRADI_2g07573v3 [Brachypodium distachyon]